MNKNQIITELKRRRKAAEQRIKHRIDFWHGAESFTYRRLVDLNPTWAQDEKDSDLYDSILMMLGE